jgi:hypothetical protein
MFDLLELPNIKNCQTALETRVAACVAESFEMPPWEIRTGTETRTWRLSAWGKEIEIKYVVTWKGPISPGHINKLLELSERVIAEWLGELEKPQNTFLAVGEHAANKLSPKHPHSLKTIFSIPQEEKDPLELVFELLLPTDPSNFFESDIIRAKINQPRDSEAYMKQFLLAFLAALGALAAYTYNKLNKRRSSEAHGQVKSTPIAQRPPRTGGYLVVSWSRANVLALDEIRAAAGHLTPALAERVNACTSFGWMDERQFEQLRKVLQPLPERQDDMLDGMYLLAAVRDERGVLRGVSQSFSFDDREQVEALARSASPPAFESWCINASVLETLGFRTHG